MRRMARCLTLLVALLLVSAAPSVAAEPIGPRVVKGREEPVEVFLIIGAGS